MFESVRPQIQRAKASNEASVTVVLNTGDREGFDALVRQLKAEGISVNPGAGTTKGWSAPFRLSWVSPKADAVAAAYIQDNIRPVIDRAKASNEASVTVVLNTGDRDGFDALVRQLNAEGISVNPGTGTTKGWSAPFRISW